MTDREVEVEVDHADLAAQAEHIELPPDETAAPEAPGAAIAGVPATQVSPQRAPWSALCPGIVSALDLLVCPAWELTDAEKAALADSLGPALDQLFPGGLGDERWAPYFRVLLIAGGIVALRYDPRRRTLKPLLLRRDRIAQAGHVDADADDAVTGPYTIGGGATSH